MDVFSRYLANNPGARRQPLPPRPSMPVRRPGQPAGPVVPTPPDYSKFLQQLIAAQPADRTEAEWETTLGPRVQPFIDQINQSTNVARGQNEYRFEQASAANRGLGESFLKLLTGGKTGDEASQYAKEQFGGSYLPAQAMQIAADTLRGLTNDFDDGDWEITGQYMQAMQQIPGIREELRAKIETKEMDDYERRVTTASLLIDETHRLYGESRAAFQWEQDRADAQAVRTEQLRMARQAAGTKGYGERKDAVSEARTLTDDTGVVWRVRRLPDGSWEPYATKQKKAASSSGGGGVAQKNAALREASDMTKGTGNLWRVRQEGGQWVVYDTGTKKASTSTASKGGISDAQKAERDLAVAVLTTHRNEIVGQPSASGIRSKGMSYTEAYDYVYSLAEATLGPYGRSTTYLNKWVQDRLRALGIGKQPIKPRGG